MEIKQQVELDINTVRALYELVDDNDGNGILSAHDTFISRIGATVTVEENDVATTSGLEELLGQISERRVSILHRDNIEYYLLYSGVGYSDTLAGGYQVAKWGYRSDAQGRDSLCISEDEHYDFAHYGSPKPYADCGRDVQLYSASTFAVSATKLDACKTAVAKDPLMQAYFARTPGSEFISAYVVTSGGEKVPAAWTDQCQAEYTRSLYRAYYENIGMKWNERTLTADDLKAADFNLGQLQTAERNAKRQSVTSDTIPDAPKPEKKTKRTDACP